MTTPSRPRPRPGFLALSASARLLRVIPALLALWLAVAWAQGSTPW